MDDAATGRTPHGALHAVGSRVWVLGDEGWLRGEVVALAGPRLRVRLEDGGGERECAASDIPLQNSSAAGVEVRARVGWRPAHPRPIVWARPSCRPAALPPCCGQAWPRSARAARACAASFAGKLARAGQRPA